MPKKKQLTIDPRTGKLSRLNEPDLSRLQLSKLNKGDRLVLIRETKVKFNGKPWLLVDLGGRKAYVWSELVFTK